MLKRVNKAQFTYMNKSFLSLYVKWKLGGGGGVEECFRRIFFILPEVCTPPPIPTPIHYTFVIHYLTYRGYKHNVVTGHKYDRKLNR